MSDELKLKIDAHVIRQLGAELISNAVVAITELIKNSHDADAKWCKLEIDPNYEEEFEVDPKFYPNDKTLRIVQGDTPDKSKAFKRFRGLVSVSDDGHGMDRETIRKSWLTVSFSEKRIKKQNNQKTELERNYTGDKGLGRLGSMQVASICRINTSTSNNKDLELITINWDQLTEGITVDQIHIEESSFEKVNVRSKGTTIELIGLNDLSYWSYDLTRFKYEIALYISPFGFFSKREDSFKLYIKVDGIEIDADDLTKNLVDLNSSAYKIKFDGEKLTLTGNSTLASFESQNNRADFQRYVLPNSGMELLPFFKQSNELSSFAIEKSKEPKYFLEWSKDIFYDELFSHDKYKNIALENPGAFESEIYDFIYNKDNLGTGPEEIGFTKSKELIQDYLSGIKLYRDGFKIGSGREDLFNLSYEQTGGSGAYSLRPSNTAGYIDLCWDKNPNLIDTSNREGLVANAHYNAFFEIFTRSLQEINSFRNKSRRSMIGFFEKKKKAEYEKPDSYTPEQAIQDLRKITESAEEIFLNIKDSKADQDQNFKNAANALTKKIKDTESLFSDPAHIKILDTLKNELSNIVSLYNTLNGRITENANHLASSSAMVNVIENQLQFYKERIEKLYGHVAIGISAQFLAHDIHSQINNITKSNLAIKNRLREINIRDIEISKSTLAIDGHTQSLSKSVAFLNPLVQAQREFKHEFTIQDGIESYISYISEAFYSDGISINFRNSSHPQKILFNHGKFYQILDNIFRNSQYWLNSYKKHTPDFHPELNIETSEFDVTIWDNGKGIRPGIESAIFDLFITEKPDGQGLGLFIVKTLLEERNCKIFLLDEENIHARKYKFRLNFSGACL